MYPFRLDRCLLNCRSRRRSCFTWFPLGARVMVTGTRDRSRIIGIDEDLFGFGIDGTKSVGRESCKSSGGTQLGVAVLLLCRVPLCRARRAAPSLTGRQFMGLFHDEGTRWWLVSRGPDLILPGPSGVPPGIPVFHGALRTVRTVYVEWRNARTP